MNEENALGCADGVFRTPIAKLSKMSADVIGS